ncbi:MAG: sulfite exporter TauE/SafE family protein [Clostridia bacterium]|nr:sulfite exporter TauE/SafE family protein [Clostridia bacterium]
MKKVKKLHIILFGGLIGIINGLFGGGGGMIVVPVLTKFFGFSQKQAQATALFVILPISIASSIIYITHNSINFASSWAVILSIIVGGAVGALLLNKLNNKIVRIIFIALILISGVTMLIR